MISGAEDDELFCFTVECLFTDRLQFRVGDDLAQLLRGDNFSSGRASSLPSAPVFEV